MYWFISTIVGSVLGSITYKIGLGNNQTEDALWAFVMWFLATLVCYAFLFLNF